MNDIASMRKMRPLPVSFGALPEAGEVADFSGFGSAACGGASGTALAFSRSARFCREMRVLGIGSRIAAKNVNHEGHEGTRRGAREMFVERRQDAAATAGGTP